MLNENISLVGTRIRGAEITHLIAEGPFSWVYSAVDVGPSSRGDLPYALKVAKPDALSNLHPDANPFQSSAKVIFEGGVANARPGPYEVLMYQYMRMAKCDDVVFPLFHEPFELVGFTMYVMDFVQGDSMRTLAAKGALSFAHILDICDTLVRLDENKDFDYHGDLKPDHFISSEIGFRLIDPGDFGRYKCENGAYSLECCITTPIYYPFLQPDDIFAFGVMLWECICLSHPLIEEPSKANSRSPLGESAERWIKRYENVGQYYLSPLRQLSLPSQTKPGISPELERLLLKGLRLEKDTRGLLQKAEGFESFAEWKEELVALEAHFPGQ